MALDLCKRGRSKWKGSEQLAFSSQAVCEARLHTRGAPISGKVVRSFLGVYGDEANPATFRSEGPRKWTYDTATAYGYAEPVSGGTEVVFSLDPASQLPMRTVTIKGIRIVAETKPRKDNGEGKGEGGNRPPPRRASKGEEGQALKVKWDHSVSNDSAHPVQIVGTGKDKKILAGGVTKLQHNLMEFTSITTINEDLSFAKGCCHAVTGKVSTVFTVDKEGKLRAPEVLKFSSQCGVAELTASDGSQASVQLKGCF